MGYIKKYKSIDKDVKVVKESNSVQSDMDKYQKLFDEAYAKNDKKSCAKYDKILVDLNKQL